MSYRPHYIASYENDSGLNTYYEPFIIPEKAFPIIEDAFVFRGRVRRRPGYKLIGRLRRSVALTYANVGDSATTYTVSDLLSSVRMSQPQAEIQSGKFSLTIGSTTYKDDGNGNVIWVSGPFTLSTATGANLINYITGALSLTFSPALPSSGGPWAVSASFPYFPTLPVMGLPTRERPATNDEQMFAFDTVYCYTYNYSSGYFDEVSSTTPTTWTGADYNFFWGRNYWNLTNSNVRLFWVTNNVDPIRYYDGTSWQTPTINTSSASGGSVPVNKALIIIPYKNRLLLMNTNEGTVGVSYNQRVRWSQIGNPIPTAANAWYSDVVGLGGFVDIPTSENIISCEFIKDILLIKCERSSWKLTYLGNPNFPFVPEQINNELGCESTFSLVPFDRGVFSISNFGITTDDSVNVSRIDQVIPQSIFQISTDDEGIMRIQGIRDYYQELVYWNFPSLQYNPQYPNKMFVYNYVNQTWSIWNDSFTCFGYFQYQDSIDWASLPYETWAEWEERWSSGTEEALFPYVAAGNNQGFVIRMEEGLQNDTFYQLFSFNFSTNPTQITIYQHNLGQSLINPQYSFIYINGIIGSSNLTSLNGKFFKAIVINPNTISLQSYDMTTQKFSDVYISSGTYVGGGTIQPLNNINVWTKVFAPFYQDAKQARVGYVDYLLSATDNGQISADFYIDENNSIPINDPTTVSNTGLLGSATVSTCPANINLIPWQATQNKIWQRQFIQAVCQNFQIQLYMSDYQMITPSIQASDINLHAMAIYLNPTARLTQ